MASHDPLRDLPELRSFRLFEHFSVQHLTSLVGASRHEPVVERRLVFTEGEASTDFFVIISGAVDATRSTRVGTQPVARLRVGQIFGETSFLDGGPRTTTLTAVQDGLLLRCQGAAIGALLRSVRGFEVALLRSLWYALTGKIRQANGFMSQIAEAAPVAPVRGERGGGEAVMVPPSEKLGVFEAQGLSTAELRLLATTLPAERYAAESLIFSEGDAGDTLYIVADGQVRIARRLSGMGEEALAIIGRGELFGEMALIDELPRSADARAHQADCTVLRLNRHDVDELLALQSAAAVFLRQLCLVLCRRYRTTVNRLVTWRILAGSGDGHSTEKRGRGSE